jgi:hypothetical protein
VDFYCPGDLSAAKKQLLKDIEKVKSVVTFPHVPQQRQGENRAVRDVDDIFTILTTIDEAPNGSLSMLPVYVSSNPDKMPSVRLYEGDFGVLMAMFERLESKVNMYGSAMSSIASEVHYLRAQFQSCQSGAQSVQPLPQRQPRPSQSVRRDINNTASQITTRSGAVGLDNQSSGLSTGPPPT